MKQLFLTALISVALNGFTQEIPNGVRILDRDQPINSLSELTTLLDGKAFYLDRWATWCAPCLIEFKHSEALHEFLDDNGIEMVYLNSDQEFDKEKWLDYMGKFQLKGNHLWLSPELKEDLVNQGYFIPRLPQYMVIDKTGNVVENNALKPSSGEELYSQLQDLLK